MNLPHAIRAARVLRNLSQRDVAERAGVHASTISQIEHGHDGYSVATLAAVADALKLSVPQLVVLAANHEDFTGIAATLNVAQMRSGIMQALFSNGDLTLPPAAGDEDEQLDLED